jgi:hypothetical protein
MKQRLFDLEVARKHARFIVKEFGEDSPDPVPIDALAHRLGVELVETRLDGARAQLVVGPHGARIVLSHRLDEPEDRSWSIAHELGHYVLGHPAPPVADLCMPRSADRRNDPHEAAADSFASAVLMPSAVVAQVCDRVPMTIDVPMELAETCGVPWTAAALRIMESSWRVCALAFSQHGQIQWVSPSLPFALLCGRRLCGGRPVGLGALARRFFATGAYPDDPDLVPASAWIEGCGPDARLLEHSVANRAHGAVMTILWDPMDVCPTRPARATLPWVTSMRDHVLDHLNDEAAAERRSKA